MFTTARFTLIIASILLQLACNASQSAGPAQQASETETRLAPDQTQVSAQQSSETESRAIKLYPLDEGPQNVSFMEFRNKLLMAARGHDAAFILDIVDPGIINISDGKRGVTEFNDLWNPDQARSRLWDTLIPVLLMGWSFRDNEGSREFCAPYITSRWSSVISQLPKNADPLDYRVIIEKNVVIRSAPNATAPVMENLSYDVVRVQSEGSVFVGSQNGGSGWLKIATLTGKEGYVLDKYIRSPGDYQACFKKVGVKWLMTEFAARE